MTERRCLLNTLHGERGELYFKQDNRRIKLASCSLKIEIYEDKTVVPCLGGDSLISRVFFSIIICDDAVFTRSIDDGFLRHIEGFDLSAEIQRSNGDYVKKIFYDLRLDEYNTAENKLTFVTNAYQSANVKHLLEEFT